MHRKDATLHFQQTFNGRAMFGFDGNRHVGKIRDFFAELLPAAGSVLESKVGGDFAAGIEDDDIVMVLGPIEARIMFDLIPVLHGCCVCFCFVKPTLLRHQST